jgi:hypothetical protein
MYMYIYIYIYADIYICVYIYTYIYLYMYVYVGINPRRIIFAERENKTMHIIRHFAADLFLDSLVYGAHSTATDALRGGLPVLTIKGDSFPNRVVNKYMYEFVCMYVCMYVYIYISICVTI